MRLVGTLDPEVGGAVVDELMRCGEEIAEQWAKLFDDVEEDDEADGSQMRPRRPGAGAAVLPDDEDGDGEHPDATAAPTTLQVQRVIMRRVDARRLAVVRKSMSDRGDRRWLAENGRTGPRRPRSHMDMGLESAPRPSSRERRLLGSRSVASDGCGWRWVVGAP